MGTIRVLCHQGRVALAGEDYEAARQCFLQALDLALHTQTPALQIESAAGGLHLLLCAKTDHVTDPMISMALEALDRHPACPASVRRYIRSFALVRSVDRANHAGSIVSLEHVQQMVANWMRGMPQELNAGVGSLFSM